jgi:hypothetical protein
MLANRPDSCYLHLGHPLINGAKVNLPDIRAMDVAVARKCLLYVAKLIKAE